MDTLDIIKKTDEQFEEKLVGFGTEEETEETSEKCKCNAICQGCL